MYTKYLLSLVKTEGHSCTRFKFSRYLQQYLQKYYKKYVKKLPGDSTQSRFLSKLLPIYRFQFSNLFHLNSADHCKKKSKNSKKRVFDSKKRVSFLGIFSHFSMVSQANIWLITQNFTGGVYGETLRKLSHSRKLKNRQSHTKTEVRPI